MFLRVLVCSSAFVLVAAVNWAVNVKASNALFTPVAAQGLGTSINAIDSNAIDSLVIQQMRKQHRPSVVIAINRGGRRIFARAWGVQNVAANIPANLDTVYQYGSITKQFTAMCIFLLAQDCRVTLDDRIGRYLPEFSGSPVRIREMLIHTSGMADPAESVEYIRVVTPQLATGPEWLMAHAAHKPTSFPPGAKTKYNNTAYTALARIVEKASGMSFDRFLQTRILNVVGMRKAHAYQALRLERNAALGYMWWDSASAELLNNAEVQGAASNQLVNALPWNLRQVDGAGYLVGDAEDLQRWDDALLEGKLLHGKWRDLYFAAGRLANGSLASVSAENPTSGNRAYFCNGGFAVVVLRGHRIFLANGGTFGFSTFTATIPDRHVSITMLSNVRSQGNDAITIPLLQLLLK